ncbi:hypothetical protein FO519_003249 [Halicephalobus sp. NKZ332]|nr:hypothetical protein FO519_003249 [Halicephalobus sp. NKZ332]
MKEKTCSKVEHKGKKYFVETIAYSFYFQRKKSVTEHFGVDVIDIDMLMVSLENAMATTGGFCAGRSYVVGHQRLSGLGYCFSASLPPLLATAASEGLRIMQNEPERLRKLQENSKKLHSGLKEALKGTKFEVIGSDISPVKHVVYGVEDRNEAGKKLDNVIEGLFEKGVMATRTRYLDKEEIFPCQPSVKIMVSAEHTGEEISMVVKEIQALVH